MSILCKESWKKPWLSEGVRTIRVHNIRHDGAEPLKGMTQIAEPKRSRLRSADDVLHLERLKTQLITVWDRAFSFAAVDLWNKFPLKLRGSKTVYTFKYALKTYLFKYKSK